MRKTALALLAALLLATTPLAAGGPDSVEVALGFGEASDTNVGTEDMALYTARVNYDVGRPGLFSLNLAAERAVFTDVRDTAAYVLGGGPRFQGGTDHVQFYVGANLNTVISDAITRDEEVEVDVEFEDARNPSEQHTSTESSTVEVEVERSEQKVTLMAGLEGGIQFLFGQGWGIGAAYTYGEPVSGGSRIDDEWGANIYLIVPTGG